MSVVATKAETFLFFPLWFVCFSCTDMLDGWRLFSNHLHKPDRVKIFFTCKQSALFKEAESEARNNWRKKKGKRRAVMGSEKIAFAWSLKDSRLNFARLALRHDKQFFQFPRYIAQGSPRNTRRRGETPSSTK